MLTADAGMRFRIILGHQQGQWIDSLCLILNARKDEQLHYCSTSGSILSVLYTVYNFNQLYKSFICVDHVL